MTRVRQGGWTFHRMQWKARYVSPTCLRGWGRAGSRGCGQGGGSRIYGLYLIRRAGPQTLSSLRILGCAQLWSRGERRRS